MTIQCKECLTECPENTQKCFRCDGALNYDKAAHDAAWEKHFVTPIGREMKKRGIAYMVMILRDDGKLAYTLEPMATYERLPNEMPAHEPLADARQSARLLATALKSPVNDEVCHQGREINL